MEYVSCNYCDSDSYSEKYFINNTKMVKCDNCGLLYINPRPEKAEIFKLYKGDYFKNNSVTSNNGAIYGYQDYLKDRYSIQQDFKRKIKTLKKYNDKGKVLDIGCAFGFFLELMRDSGWEEEGVELNGDAVEFARQELGLNIKHGAFADFAYSGCRYDLVTMFDVLEHLQDPKTVLSEIHRILKSDGLLVLTTLNIDSLVARILGSKWEDIRRSKTHLWMFSRDAVVKMLELCDFEIIDISSYGKIFELGYALKRSVPYSPRLFMFLYDIINKLGLERMRVYIDVRSKLTYYARKSLR